MLYYHFFWPKTPSRNNKLLQNQVAIKKSFLGQNFFLSNSLLNLIRALLKVTGAQTEKAAIQITQKITQSRESHRARTEPKISRAPDRRQKYILQILNPWNLTWFRYLFRDSSMQILHLWDDLPRLDSKESHYCELFFFGPLQKKKNQKSWGGWGGFIIANWTLTNMYTPPGLLPIKVLWPLGILKPTARTLHRCNKCCIPMCHPNTSRLIRLCVSNLVAALGIIHGNVSWLPTLPRKEH